MSFCLLLIRSKRSGHTLMELMIAISVVAILVPLIFAAYLMIYKQFKFSTKKAEKVINTVVVKTKIDKLFKDIEDIKSTYKTSFEYSGNTDSKSHLVSHRSNTLYLDNKVTIKKVKSFKYSISEKKSASGRHLLLWEAVLENGNWIAGARVVGFD